MTRKGDTTLATALKKFSKKIKKQIESSIHNDLTVDIVVDDARDSSGKASGAVAIEIEIKNSNGWPDDGIIEIHGTVGLDSGGKRGKKEDEAYLDGITVGDWIEGSKSIELNGCAVGEFLVHIFALYAIKAGNLSILLDNAAGERGEYIYKKVGFIKSKGERAMYGEDNEMIVSLTGKTKNKDSGQLWRERYNKLRKKIGNKIKSSAKCKTFWKKNPPIMETPIPLHLITRGGQKTRKQMGGVITNCPSVHEIIDLKDLKGGKEYIFKAVAMAIINPYVVPQPHFITNWTPISQDMKNKCRKGYFVSISPDGAVYFADNDAFPNINLWRVYPPNENIWEMNAERNAQGLNIRPGAGGGKRRRKTHKKKVSSWESARKREKGKYCKKYYKGKYDINKKACKKDPKCKYTDMGSGGEWCYTKSNVRDIGKNTKPPQTIADFPRTHMKRRGRTRKKRGSNRGGKYSRCARKKSGGAPPLIIGTIGNKPYWKKRVPRGNPYIYARIIAIDTTTSSDHTYIQILSSTEPEWFPGPIPGKAIVTDVWFRDDQFLQYYSKYPDEESLSDGSAAESKAEESGGAAVHNRAFEKQGEGKTSD